MTYSAGFGEWHQSANRTSPAPIAIWLEKLTVFLLVTGFLMVFARQGVAGVIRAYLPAVWYLPDLVVAVGAFAAIGRIIIKYEFVALTFLLLFCISLLVSLLTLEVGSVALGFRMAMIFIAAYFANLWGRQYDLVITRVISAVGLIAIAGVLFDKYVGLGYQDMTFSGFLGERGISQQWWLADQTRRIAGFGISSTDTSLVIVIAVLIMSDRTLGPFPTWLTLLIMPFAFWAVSLTQQRATMAWFVILWCLVCGVAIVFGRKGQVFSYKLLKILALFALVAAAIVPFALYKFDVADLFGTTAPSLYDRTFNVWPDAIDWLLNNPRITLIGGGIGSVGDPFLFTNPNIYLADNIFLSVSCSIGLIGGTLLWIRMGIGIAFARSMAPPRNSAVAILCLMLLNGITAGIIVGAAGSTMLGYALGIVFRPLPKEAAHG